MNYMYAILKPLVEVRLINGDTLLKEYVPWSLSSDEAHQMIKECLPDTDPQVTTLTTK